MDELKAVGGQMGSPASEFDTGSINEVPPVALSDASVVSRTEVQVRS